MARSVLLWLSIVLVLVFGGCAPNDPLDRKIKADTPAEFARWWDRTREKFPDEQRTEIFRIIRYLQDSTPRLKAMSAQDHYDPLCKKINGLTVRDLMVLGYEDSIENLQKRMLLETRKLAGLVATISESDDPASREYAESMLSYTRDRIAEWKDKIADNNRRIVQLTSAAQP
jgi:hypothetical protein